MSFSKTDLAETKWSLLALLLALGGASALYDYTSGCEQREKQQLGQSQRQLNDARNQLANAQNDMENMASYQMEYDALVAQKVIGAEQRLDWIEGLDKMRMQKVVSGFKYAIAPQKTYTPNPPQAAGNFNLNLSPMTLHLELLHEEELLRFFRTMSAQLPGWFLIDHCALERNNTGSLPLKADCAGGWFTMQSRSNP